MKKQKDIVDLVPVNKNLPLVVGAGLTISFSLGLLYSPIKPIIYNGDYDKQNIITTTKVETVFVDKVMQIKEVEVKEKATINENAYSDRNYGYSIRNYTLSKLKEKMEGMGFKELDNLDLFKLRRIWLAYHYNSMFMNVHLITDFPISMVYSFFIIEATTAGIETGLWRLHANAGGVKALRNQKSVTYRTREVIRGRNKYINAKFFSARDTKQGIELWAGVLNSDRYKKCKNPDYSLPPKKVYLAICKCIYKSGYHTDTDYQFRASLMEEYWKIKKHFP